MERWFRLALAVLVVLTFWAMLFGTGSSVPIGSSMSAIHAVAEAEAPGDAP